MTSSIYNGSVIHKRFKPKKHFFKYNVFSLLIDLSELEELDKKIKFFSIIHLAGNVGNEISYNSPLKDCENNILVTLKVLEFAKKTKCRHFIYTSSMSVYGNLPSKPVPENYNCNPKSYYGISKLASENYVRIFNNEKFKMNYIKSAKTLEELADKIGVNKENLLNTVKNNNDYVKTGKDLEFNRFRK